MHVSIIVAKTKNNVIGLNNQLPWHLPKDLQHFRQVTMGHHVIMGRKTFVSIGKPLPSRKLIIVTRNPNYYVEACIIVQDITTALAIAEQAGETEVFIAGGGKVYQETLALADKIYLTEVQVRLKGDTFFPAIKTNKWREIKRIHHSVDGQHLYAYDFVELVKRR